MSQKSTDLLLNVRRSAMGGSERKRERKREIVRDRQTDRQSERERERAGG